MIKKKCLISVATYKEAENLKKLIKEIRIYDNDTKILIINDFSDLQYCFSNKLVIIVRQK